jgi:dipeptidyl aminopeptidase/acylaminoacyl peptidase
MSISFRSRLCIAVLYALLASPAAARQAALADSLPYDLAFDVREFPWSTSIAVAGDGERIAYTVRQRPPDVNLDARFMSNGTPSSVVGARVLLTDRRTDSTRDICPGGNCWGAVWSPDGRSVAFYSDAQGPPQLWVHDTASGRSRRLSSARIKAKLWAGAEPVWSPDAATLYVPLAPATGPGAWLPPADAAARPAAHSREVFVWTSGDDPARDAEVAATATDAAAQRREHYLRENNAALAAIDARTGAARIVVAAEAMPRPSVLRISASGRWLSYLSVINDHGISTQLSGMDLAVVPSSGGTLSVLATDLPMLQDYHRLNYAWHPREDRLVFLRDGELWLVDFDAHGPAAPRRLGVGLGPLAPTLHWFTRDGLAVVVGTDPVDDRAYGDARPRGIAVLPLDGSGGMHMPIGDEWIFQDVLRAGVHVAWQPDARFVTLLLTERASGDRAMVRFDVAAGTQHVLWKGLATFTNMTASAHHDQLFTMFEDIVTPPDIYRFDADLGATQRVSHIEPRLDAVAAGSAAVFETIVPLHDGSLERVRTAVLLPRGARRGDRIPAIVMLYPGSDRSTAAARFGGGGDITVPNLVFTSRGYAVILPHLRLGPNREAGHPLDEMIDVLLPQVYRAAELGYVDVKRIAVGGQSFGGYGTAATISGTNLFRAAIAVSGIYDLPGTYGHVTDDGGSFWIGWAEGGQARMGTHPWADLRRYIDNSPYYRADRIRTPLLLVHGTDDGAYHDAQKLFSALRRLERSVQLASYTGQGHVISNWSRPHAVDAAMRMVEFLQRHLGDAPPRHTIP